MRFAPLGHLKSSPMPTPRGASAPGKISCMTESSTFSVWMRPHRAPVCLLMGRHHARHLCLSEGGTKAPLTNYRAFLKAFLRGEVDRLVVVERLTDTTAVKASASKRRLWRSKWGANIVRLPMNTPGWRSPPETETPRRQIAHSFYREAKLQTNVTALCKSAVAAAAVPDDLAYIGRGPARVLLSAKI
jgi:hypothetical protein